MKEEPHQFSLFFDNDENTKIIALYLESLNNGVQFFKVLKKTVLRKPVVVLKGGKSGKEKSACLGRPAASFAFVPVISNTRSKYNLITSETQQDNVEENKEKQ